jgi:hypothetical protein
VSRSASFTQLRRPGFRSGCLRIHASMLETHPHASQGGATSPLQGRGKLLRRIGEREVGQVLPQALVGGVHPGSRRHAHRAASWEASSGDSTTSPTARRRRCRAPGRPPPLPRPVAMTRSVGGWNGAPALSGPRLGHDPPGGAVPADPHHLSGPPGGVVERVRDARAGAPVDEQDLRDPAQAPQHPSSAGRSSAVVLANVYMAACAAEWGRAVTTRTSPGSGPCPPRPARRCATSRPGPPPRG